MIRWLHSPGSTVPYKSVDRTYNVGQVYNRDGTRYRALFCGCLKAMPIGEARETPEEAVKDAEAHWTSIQEAA